MLIEFVDVVCDIVVYMLLLVGVKVYVIGVVLFMVD